MSRNRSFYSQIGITKKDLNEMSGCMASMVVIPLYLIIDGIKTLGSIINGISNLVIKASEKQKIKTEKVQIQQKRLNELSREQEFIKLKNDVIELKNELYNRCIQMRNEILEITTINSLPTTTDEWRKPKLERMNFIDDFCKEATIEIEKCDKLLNNISNLEEAINSLCKLRDTLNYYLNLDRKKCNKNIEKTEEIESNNTEISKVIVEIDEESKFIDFDCYFMKCHIDLIEPFNIECELKENGIVTYKKCIKNKAITNLFLNKLNNMNDLQNAIDVAVPRLIKIIGNKKINELAYPKS